MEYRRFNNTIVARIDRGEEILAQIKELALKEKAGKQRQEISGEQMNLFDFLKE